MYTPLRCDILPVKYSFYKIQYLFPIEKKLFASELYVIFIKSFVNFDCLDVNKCILFFIR